MRGKLFLLLSCFLGSCALFDLCAAVPEGFIVTRNVRDYGAVGDGRHDDSAAFILALTEDKATTNRTGPWNASQYNCQTTRPSFVYVPAGTYVITQTLPLTFYTQLVGDAQSRPTLRFSVPTGGSSYRCLDAGTDEGQGNGWYGGVNQNNFYHQLRNVVVDATSCDGCLGIHWQVAQATVIQNVEFHVASSSVGVYMESGSGGFIADVRIFGGSIGMQLGNQQFTFRNVTIEGAATGIAILWQWSMSFVGFRFVNNSVAFTAGSGANAVSFIDCDFESIGVAFEVFGPTTQFYVENARMTNVRTALRTSSILVTQPFRNYFIGRGHQGQFVTEEPPAPKRPAALVDADGRYIQVPRPQYAPSEVVQLNLTNGTDVSDALETQLASCAQAGKAALLPYGTYFVSRTVLVPTGTRLYGQAWSRIAARGATFANASAPTAVLKLGNAGDVGVMQLSDLLLTSQGPTPGAIELQWNTRGAVPGDCGTWDVHFRVGGAVGTHLGSSECPKTVQYPSAAGGACLGVHTMLHLMPTSGNVYIENMWGWLADHDIDSGPQLNLFSGRGFVSEAQHGGVWMYGVAFEHSFMGQLIFSHVGAPHLVTIAQTETPYYQPMFALDASTPGIGIVPTDPAYTQRSAYAFYVAANASSALVTLFNSGFYSFFDQWSTSCGNNKWTLCQTDLVVLNRTDAVVNTTDVLRMALMNTHGASNVLSDAKGPNATNYAAASFQNGFCQTLSFLRD